MTTRRNLLKGAVVTAGLAGLSASRAQSPTTGPVVEWRLASSFPKSLDTLFGGAPALAKRVEALTEGKFVIKVHGPGELMPAFDVVDGVQQEKIECAHTCSYYFVKKNKAFAFETTLPFGLNQRQQNAWMHHGGGNQLIQEFMSNYGIMTFSGGNTGTQMGGWFKKPLLSALDLRGLKMRIGGLGGEIIDTLGAKSMQLPGGEIFGAMQSGKIDAAEWVGPYDDEKLGLHKVAKYYYFPGWWESNTNVSFMVNLKAWARLPKAFQEAFRSAASEVSADMMAKYDFLNPGALKRLIEADVKIVPYPPELLRLAQKNAFEFYDAESQRNPAFKKLFVHWLQFRDTQFDWHRIAEHSYANFVYTTKVRR